MLGILNLRLSQEPGCFAVVRSNRVAPDFNTHIEFGHTMRKESSFCRLELWVAKQTDREIASSTQKGQRDLRLSLAGQAKSSRSVLGLSQLAECHGGQ